MSERINIAELRKRTEVGAEFIPSWPDFAPGPDEVLALVEAVEAARYLAWGAFACACVGPSEDSLPGECACQTDARQNEERLKAALDRFDFGAGGA